MIRIAEAISHIRLVISKAELVTDPFPYLMMPDLLPTDWYTEICQRWPRGEMFRENPSMQRWDAKLPKALSLFPVEEQPFWRAVLLLTNAANRAIIERLRPCFAEKFEPFFGSDWARETADMIFEIDGAQLARYSGKVGLAPHVDHPRLVTNAFLYCPEPGADDPTMGTVLYRSLGLSLPLNLDLRPDWVRRFLRRALTTPYRANLGFAYINTPRAFHAVDERDIGDHDRRLLLFGSKLSKPDTARLLDLANRPPEPPVA